MTQVPHLFLERLMLLGVQFEVSPSEPLAHLLQIVKMIVEGPANNNQININSVKKPV
jgi:hypothetical protein